jgi:hypothetical protein
VAIGVPLLIHGLVLRAHGARALEALAAPQVVVGPSLLVDRTGAAPGCARSARW